MKNFRETFRRFKRRMKGDIELRDKYQVIFDDDVMTILYNEGPGAVLIVSFTGIGHSTGGIDLQTPEFSKSSFGCPTLYIIDKHRSWGNRLDWEKIEAVVRENRRGRRLVTLGNSMGGFLAILSAHRLGADVSIAFAPQWSVNPQIVPFETRWRKYTKFITDFRFPSLANCFASDCRFHVFCGSNAQDLQHLDLFPEKAGNLDIYRLDCGGHSVSAELKNSGLLYNAIAACLDGKDVGKIFLDRNWP